MTTIKQACEFFQRWNNSDFPNQRMGQAFMNHFNVECDHEGPDVCLFNEEDNKLAAKRIWSMCQVVDLEDQASGGFTEKQTDEEG